MSTLAATNLKNPSAGSNNIVLGTDGSTTLAKLTGGAITSGTSVASTSGTAIDFTGIPSWVKRVTVMFNLVSTSGASPLEVRLGSSVGFGSTTYSSSAQNAAAGNFSTTGLVIEGSSAATLSRAGAIIISNFNANVWVSNGSSAHNAGTATVTSSSGGVASLSATLTQVRITAANGTDTFDAGSINILYEG